MQLENNSVLLTLPNELGEQICQWLPDETHGRMAQACKQLNTWSVEFCRGDANNKRLQSILSATEHCPAEQKRLSKRIQYLRSHIQRIGFSRQGWTEETDLVDRDFIENSSEYTNLQALKGLRNASTVFRKLPRASHTRLQTLELSGQDQRKIIDSCQALCVFLPNLKELIWALPRGLRFLDLSGRNNFREIHLPECNQLQVLNVAGCGSLETLELKQSGYSSDLRILNVAGCVNLRKLTCERCDQLPALDLSECRHLACLILRNCYSLRKLTLNECLALQRMNIQGDFGALNEQDLSRCVRLEELSLINFDRTDRPKFNMKGCDNLQKLILSRIHHDLNLSEMHHLRQLHLYACDVPNNINLPGALYLETVKFDYCDNLQEVNLSGCNKLQEVELEYCPALAKVNFERCSELSKVEIAGCPALQVLKLAACGNLRELDLGYGYQSEYYQNFHTLNLSNCCNLEQIDISNCRVLRDVNLSNCSRLKSLGMFLAHPFFPLKAIFDMSRSRLDKFSYAAEMILWRILRFLVNVVHEVMDLIEAIRLRIRRT